jgi:phthalate 4,5-dioxygenase
MFYFIAWGGESCVSTEQWREFNRAVPGVDLEPNWLPKRRLENNFLQDRQAMRQGSFTGIKGIPNQDIAMWVGLGPIVDRTRDMLGASDLAIVEFRRLMVDAARRVEAGEVAIGTGEPRVRHVEISSFEGVIAKTTNWRALAGPRNRAAA